MGVKTTAWVHAISKTELLNFLYEYTLERVLRVCKEEVLKKGAQKGQSIRKDDKAAVLQVIDIDY